ncbi:helix-turn-helix domain-containing protein [Vibrio sp. ZSDE26]|uniref:Helix-turn-helix domain-containing protein n=1 Tax=Vibrio amylolyticus TaxID=2847292 RepID=A0A9X1XJZ2_9VIBR|nr:helix-turn-helix domain-containing protein [Vibrio amylolyticus]MCK6263520.1 helix-turn-helix domain-containing protein [Vibrio amylolyticus]
MIRTGYTKILLEVFSKHNIDIHEILRESGLPPDLFDTNNDFLPVEPVRRLVYLLSSQVGVNSFSEMLRIAFRQRIIPQILGLFKNVETVRDALSKSYEIFSYDTPGSNVTLKSEHEQCWFCRDAPYEDTPSFIWGELFAILYIEELLQSLTKSNWKITKVKIQHTDSDVVQAALGKSVQLYIGHPNTAVYIDEETLNSKGQVHESDLLFNKPLVEWHTSFSDSVFTALLPYVKEHSLTVEQAAKLLKLTPRTFQRRLKEERTSFRKVKESLMLSVSCELMEEGHSLTHISSQLGYNNISHYSRAFKRVTGLTPKSYRKSILGLC